MKRIFALICSIAILCGAMGFVTVLGEESSLEVNKTTYTEGEPILVTATGENADWVGIYLVGDVIPDQTSIVWYYVAKDGNTSGTAKNLSEDVRVERADLADFPAGEYVIYLFENDGYTILEQKNITVKAKNTITATANPIATPVVKEKALKTNKTTFKEGEAILVTATGEGLDWVGLYLRDDILGTDQSIRWYYAAKDGNQSGKQKDIREAEGTNESRADYADVPAGEYTIYFCANDKWDVIQKIDITVKADTTTTTTAPTSTVKPTSTAKQTATVKPTSTAKPTLTPAPTTKPTMKPVVQEKTLKTNKTTYKEGEAILVTATGEGLDWVGLYLRDDTLETDQSIRWYYVAKDENESGKEKNIREAEGSNASRSDYVDVPAGEYVIYLLENDGYNILAKQEITVKAATNTQTNPQAPASVTYERTNAFPGAADGKLTITAGEDTLPDSYVAYWANAQGPLTNYTAFAPIVCKEKVTEYTMVANTLIPKEADRILVYAMRKKEISETAATVLLPEDCNKYDFGMPLYEMQVMSDIHLNTSLKHIHNKHFATALQDIKTVSPNSIGIFVNGDIADHGLTSEYRALQKLIEQAGEGLPKVYCAIGNHDLADGPYAEKLEAFLEYTDPGVDSVYYDLWLNDVHFIFLGSEEPGLNAQLSKAQLDWFREKLAENRNENRPIYVFLHQGLIDTVAGTFAYQEWHGIKQGKQFAQILKDYPEVILFSGHSHWEMDSAHSMKARDEALPTIFNTASAAYLWNDASMSTNVGIEGSQGYYIQAYADKILVLGRDYVNGKWIASAQYLVQYPQSGKEGNQDPGENNETPATTDSAKPDDDTSSKTDAFPIGVLVGLGSGLLSVAAAVVGFVRKKKKAAK